MSPRAPRRPFRAAAVLLVALLMTGCAAAAGGGLFGGDPTPRLADVTPVADPLGWEGASTARLAESGIEPIDTGEQTIPTSLIDSQGTQVEVADTSRILALDIYGSLSRIVYELGFGDSVVGRDVSSGFSEISSKPLVTENGHDLNAEAILALAPTLLITDTSLGPWDVVLQVRDAGIPVVVVDSSRSTDNVGTLIEQVAAALGVPERGAALAERTVSSVQAKIAEIAAVAPAEGERLRMVFLYVRGQAGVYYMFGEGSGAQSLIAGLAGHDVAAEIGWTGMRPVTDEGLIAAQPDLILMMTKGLESVGGVDGLMEALPAVAQTPAGQHRRIVDMDDTEILSFGPATADVLDALAVAVYAPDQAR